MKIKNCFAVSITTIICSIVVMVSCTHKSQIRVATVSFSRDIVPLFESSCALNSGCHLGANNANDQIDLDSINAYNTIVNKHLVIVSSPSSSLLYVEVASGIMPKNPYSKLSDQQIDLLLTWIGQGAVNN